MPDLLLRDSQFVNGEKICDNHNMESYFLAVEKLNSLFNTKQVKILSLKNSATSHEIDCPIWYKTEGTRYVHNTKVPNRGVFFTSHYIGSCTIEGVNITIKPRYGNRVCNHLLSCACNLYLPKGESEISSSRVSNYWFIALLWKAVLDRAISTGQIPKEYKTETKRIRSFKGRLNVQKQIKFNLVDQSRFYCTYRKLTMDNTINQVIRYTYSILKEKKLNTIIQNVTGHEKKLESFGVKNKPEDDCKIDKIRYTKMNLVYKPVMEFSKVIIANHSAESKNDTNNKVDAAYFIDMAELWEMYLLKILQRHLGDEFKIYSPNLSAGGFLLEENFRSIRPDIIIERNGFPIMIIDAKYKDYTNLGRTAHDYNSVSREDLYQMSTYLYHYGQANKIIYGIFVSPVEQIDVEIKSLSHNPLHKIGLVNLNLQKADKNPENIKLYELEFVNRIKKILEIAVQNSN